MVKVLESPLSFFSFFSKFTFDFYILTKGVSLSNVSAFSALDVKNTSTRKVLSLKEKIFKRPVAFPWTNAL
jgi:hypothetical protein